MAKRNYLGTVYSPNYNYVTKDIIADRYIRKAGIYKYKKKAFFNYMVNQLYQTCLQNLTGESYLNALSRRSNLINNHDILKSAKTCLLTPLFVL